MVIISLSRAVRIDSVGAGCGDCSIARAPSPILGTIAFRAAIRYVRNRPVSLSLSSRESQAVPAQAGICWQPASHSLANVVLPKPAGAEMRVVGVEVKQRNDCCSAAAATATATATATPSINTTITTATTTATTTAAAPAPTATDTSIE